jgi:hypothetical protein
VQRKVLIVQPHAKALATHEFFAFIIKLFIMGEVEVVNISAGANRLVNLNSLLIRWFYFRFETL